jgi:diadenosine tetraphosphatase ApaH/serine/threonine PP2A family protein phosphatase
MSIHIEAGRKYFINTGSVGLSRDGDPRAAYALYDIDRGEITIRRVPYDYDGLEERTRNGPLGPHGVHRLMKKTNGG